MTTPLDGIRVLELGQLIAGPFAGRMLAEFGADVIKIEPPGVGDPLRKWRLLHDGTSVWWAVQSRNKSSVTLDLRTPEGQDVVRRLVAEADVLIENFRPGTLEGWGLGWDTLSAINPRLVMLRVSGYGQSGPYRDRPGFGAIAEAMGGLRHLTGEPGRTPVRVGISLGDSLSALHGVIGVLLALRHRDRPGGTGQVVDVALYESVFNMIGQDPALAHNDGRVAQVERLDAAIGAWTAQHDLDDVLAALHEARIPSGRIYDVADIASDPHYRARDMIVEDALPDGTPVLVPGIVPKLAATPGRIARPAPALGADTDTVLESLGVDAATRDDWRARGVI
ncbi:CaiB/BaiF CoA transferase family protein [Burkholderia multivorans]|uniref:CaiB/BaiF CoA transferase family protein n=1 Tax=Burkholderia multivorans TaxID=87883 RepID=UPI000CFED5EB|nr:CoA transferase [Burkholderia multivorans]PRE08736.1 formyl-CoA transferase [Burkholderia multivorans]PRG48436.1 formyl-CoA transferase [Burkholderia multivorans]